MTTPTILKRRDAGAAWLDEHRPGWWQRINLDTLDLGEPCRCVLGQEFAPDVDPDGRDLVVANGYQLAVAKLRDGPPAAFALGFTITGARAYEELSWETLTAAWRELILARRAGTETTR